MRILIKRTLATALFILVANLVMAQGTIKMGSLATLEGAFTVLGEDSMRGVKMALNGLVMLLILYQFMNLILNQIMKLKFLIKFEN